MLSFQLSHFTSQTVPECSDFTVYFSACANLFSPMVFIFKFYYDYIITTTLKIIKLLTLYFSFPLLFITGYCIWLPILYSRTLFIIHPIGNSLHLLIPNSQCVSSFPLGNHSLFYMSVNLQTPSFFRTVLGSQLNWVESSNSFLLSITPTRVVCLFQMMTPHSDIYYHSKCVLYAKAHLWGLCCQLWQMCIISSLL